MGVARIFQRGGHTESYRGYSPDCHLNIVGYFLTKRLTKGGGGVVTGTPGLPLATSLFDTEACMYDLNWALLFQKNRLLWIRFNFFFINTVIT